MHDSSSGTWLTVPHACLSANVCVRMWCGCVQARAVVVDMEEGVVNHMLKVC